ncbi:GGDEF domain-containing protein [Candidatus Pacearchaeota archaeon]|jgi:diguanylate cyclase (GGDEF)-like protein|nr:GGDEF domain-containing protein [Candidatus Pacearchaeota archaeon]
MKKIDDKLHALDPRFRKKVEELFDTIIESFSSLYEVATHDEKTGLYNNKFFETILDMEIEKAKRGKEKLSLMITDIDFFKKINDKYGHMKADELLKRLADLMIKLVRKSDIVARFGGEEFMILLPETNLEKANLFATRLKRAVHSDAVLKKHGVRISGGVTQYKEKDNKKKLKERVDKALYQAKETGRDKFVVIK